MNKSNKKKKDQTNTPTQRICLQSVIIAAKKTKQIVEAKQV